MLKPWKNFCDASAEIIINGEPLLIVDRRHFQRAAPGVNSREFDLALSY
jgi:hypothetical protein